MTRFTDGPASRHKMRVRFCRTWSSRLRPALKTGILSTSAPVVRLWTPNSSYRPEAIPALYAKLSHADMVVGARALSSSGVPWIRRPAKWFLNLFAGFLVGSPVPDLNSGQRVMKRDIVLRYLHLMPNGFSFTSTITLALLANGHPVIFEPVTYTKRSGHSKIRAAHFLGFLLLVVRSTVLFNPLKVFLPLGALMFLVGMIKLAQDLWLDDLSDTSVMVFLAALIVWALGLLADMVSRLQIHPPWPPERATPPNENSDHAGRGPRLPRS